MEHIEFKQPEYVKSKFFYRVDILVMKGLGGESYAHKEEHKGDNLLLARQHAVESYNKLSKGFESGEASFHLPFASAKDYVHGENSIYSLRLIFVEQYGEEEYENFLAGEDEDMIAEGTAVEKAILRQKGYLDIQLQ